MFRSYTRKPVRATSIGVVAQAIRRRDAGIAAAADANPCRVHSAKVLIVRAMLDDPTGRGTIDDAPLNDGIPNHGKRNSWRGAVVAGLAKSGFAEIVDFVPSSIVENNRRRVALLELTDRPAALRWLANAEFAISGGAGK